MIKFPKYIFIDDTTIETGPADNVLRSEMEVGPQKTRPIQSIPMIETRFEIAISESRLGEFKNWIRSIGYGSQFFIMFDPTDGVEKKFRIVEMDALAKSGTLYRSRLTVESYDL